MTPFLNTLSFHILVVEDDPDLHLMLKAALEYDNYHATFTPKKSAAVALLSSVKIDLVIADVGLPDGLGTEVVKHAAAVGVPSIVMTGLPQHMVDCDLKGVAYLAKPFRVEQLRQEIRHKLKLADAV